MLMVLYQASFILIGRSLTCSCEDAGKEEPAVVEGDTCEYSPKRPHGKPNACNSSSLREQLHSTCGVLAQL